MSNREWNRFTYPSHYPEINDKRSVPKRPSLIDPSVRRTEMLDTRDRELERFLGIDRLGGGGAAVTLVVAAADSLNPENADFVASGTDDQDTIQAAYDALPKFADTYAMGTIVLREGTYNITGGLTQTDASPLVRFRGEYNPFLILTGSSYTLATAGNWYDLSIAAFSATDVTVFNGVLNASNVSITGAQGSAPVVSGGTYFDCTIQSSDSNSAVIGDPSSTLTVTRGTVNNSNGGYAVDMGAGFPVILNGTNVIGNISANPYAFTADDCDISSCLIALDSSLGNGTGPASPGIVRCRVQGVAHQILTATGGQPTSGEFLPISHNYFHQATISDDSSPFVFDGVEEIVFSHNEIELPGGAPTYLVEVTGVTTGMSITHNTLVGNATGVVDTSLFLLDTNTSGNLVCMTAYTGTDTYITDSGSGNTITCSGGV